MATSCAGPRVIPPNSRHPMTKRCISTHTIMLARSKEPAGIDPATTSGMEAHASAPPLLPPL
eukprot:CAMPEP_0183359090 /NCGR_PEP_ID=MMETSP0164_2-20130417/51187_1 /TAXON_ID=221442 /ORGANISM="Coccolithus pelagicus ssp braarudi, Strain PLY182g" /LENGTH=61 /DNA_ID=CAMNT_0025533125 /DNA_START=368 /DNA_END=550 /DNA_ORIENTATION=+